MTRDDSHDLSRLSPRFLMRIARRIHRQLVSLATSRDVPILPEPTWQELRRLFDRLNWLRQQQWHTAVTRVQADFASQHRHLTRQLAECERQLKAGGPSIRVLSEYEIYGELKQVASEFDQVRIETRHSRIAVTTDDIVLEDQDLGPFEILLEWKKVGSGRAYTVVAQEPRCPESNSGVTHPHVHNAQLCEGDGRAAISHALQEGRLSDFFILVRQVLSTYNAASAYVSLEDWEGRTCTDCGQLAPDDDSALCNICHQDVCGACLSICQTCHEPCCGSCGTACHACDEEACERCQETCEGCQATFCRSCLTEGRCDACREPPLNETENTHAPNQTTTAEPLAPETGHASPTHTSLQPHGLGEALIPA